MLIEKCQHCLCKQDTGGQWYCCKCGWKELIPIYYIEPFRHVEWIEPFYPTDWLDWEKGHDTPFRN